MGANKFHAIRYRGHASKKEARRAQQLHALASAGAISDRLLKILVTKERDITLITRDFTKLFITPEAYVEFTRRGGRLLVLQRSRLIAVTLNPTSPQGFLLDSKSTCEALSDALQTPVYDVMKIEI